MRNTELTPSGEVLSGGVSVGRYTAILFRGDSDAGHEVPVPESVIDRYGTVTYLCSVEIYPEHRGQGFMRSVVDAVAKSGRPVVIYPVPLTDPDPTEAEIQALRDTYLRMGFTPVDGEMMVLEAVQGV